MTTTPPERWAILGGGILGMTLAHRLRQRGKQVTLFEAADCLGGLAAHLQPHQESAHLGGRGVAIGHDVEGALGLVDAQRLAVAHLRQKTAKIADIAAHRKTLSFCPLPPRAVAA